MSGHLTIVIFMLLSFAKACHLGILL